MVKPNGLCVYLPRVATLSRAVAWPGGEDRKKPLPRPHQCLVFDWLNVARHWEHLDSGFLNR